MGSKPQKYLIKNGAEGRTRTGTACATAPSRRRVYQFHHFGFFLSNQSTIGTSAGARSCAGGAAGCIGAGVSITLLGWRS